MADVDLGSAPSAWLWPCQPWNDFEFLVQLARPLRLVLGLYEADKCKVCVAAIRVSRRDGSDGRLLAGLEMGMGDGTTRRWARLGPFCPEVLDRLGYQLWRGLDPRDLGDRHVPKRCSMGNSPSDCTDNKVVLLVVSNREHVRYPHREYSVRQAWSK